MNAAVQSIIATYQPVVVAALVTALFGLAIQGLRYASLHITIKGHEKLQATLRTLAGWTAVQVAAAEQTAIASVKARQAEGKFSTEADYKAALEAAKQAVVSQVQAKVTSGGLEADAAKALGVDPANLAGAIGHLVESAVADRAAAVVASPVAPVVSAPVKV